MKKLIKYLLFTWFLLWGNTIFSQPDIILKTFTDTATVAIDIPLDIHIKPHSKIDSFQILVLNREQFIKAFHVPSSATNQTKALQPQTDDNETDFEISDFGKWKGHDKTVIPVKGDTNRIKLKIWDPGIFMILPAIIKPDSTGMQDTVIFFEDKEPLVVLPGINPQDTLKQISPINDIIKEKKVWTDYKWWIIAAALLVSVILALLFLPKLFLSRDSKETVQKQQKPVLPAHVIALNKLAKLKKEKIWKEGKVKEFQSQLTHILREYLENRYNIKALEQTTSEIINSLSAINIPEKYISLISEILQIADMVKFAKAKPEEDINEIFLDKTIEFVEETKQLPGENKAT